MRKLLIIFITLISITAIGQPINKSRIKKNIADVGVVNDINITVSQPVMDTAMLILPPKTYPEKQMTAIMMTPPVENAAMKLLIHEAEVTIRFAADRDVIDADFRILKNGERFDNQEQLHMIDELMKDSTMDILSVKIVSHASPESPHIHNIDIAKRRSKKMVEYISKRYNLPKSIIEYYYFPENWEGFRTLAESSDEISETQRKLLLDLIDSPAASHEEYDKKERILKTDPRYSGLYYGKILPEWFPNLRTATVTIRRRPKLLSDDKLIEMIKTTPHKMKVDQMFRAAGIFPEDSDEYSGIMELIMMYYPDNQVAIINTATSEVLKGNYDYALHLLERAEDFPEVYNLLGIIATSKEDYKTARRYFDKAGTLSDAKHNVKLLNSEDLHDGLIPHNYGKWMLNKED